MTNHIIVNNLKRLIKEKGISQNALARKTNLDKGTISKIVHNELYDMKITTVERLIGALDVTLHELFTCYKREYYFEMCLAPYLFNEKNLRVLKKIIEEDGAHFTYQWKVYKRDMSINLYLTDENLGIVIDTNMSVFLSDKGIRLTVVHFEVSNNKAMDFDNFRMCYEKYLTMMESYAKAINVDLIRFAITPYFNPMANYKSVMPSHIKEHELKLIVKHVGDYNVVNSLFQWCVLRIMEYKTVYELFDGFLYHTTDIYKYFDFYLLQRKNNSINRNELSRLKIYNSNLLKLNNRYLSKVLNENNKTTVAGRRLCSFRL